MDCDQNLDLFLLSNGLCGELRFGFISRCCLLVLVLGCFRVGSWFDLGGPFFVCFRIGSVCTIVPPVDYLEICLMDFGGPIAFASRSGVSS